MNPDANLNEYYAIAIGVRNQSARTYLERQFEAFAGLSREQLIDHAVSAVKSSAQAEQELNGKSVSVAIVGRDEGFTFLSAQEVDGVLQRLAQAMEVDS